MNRIRHILPVLLGLLLVAVVGNVANGDFRFAPVETAARPGTFASGMDAEPLGRWNDYWGGYSKYQMDTSGAAPFGKKTAFTQAGEIKTVTTFDQFGRPYIQYGLDEGELFHQHTFTYPTNPLPGTGWTPIRNPGVPVK
jgi:hypothetical protein